MSKIKILDTKEAILKTAKYFTIHKMKAEMFGKTYNSYEEDEDKDFYYIENFAFHKDSCQIIHEPKILKGEKPDDSKWYQRWNGTEWMDNKYKITAYRENSDRPYFMAGLWSEKAREVKL